MATRQPKPAEPDRFVNADPATWAAAQRRFESDLEVIRFYAWRDLLRRGPGLPPTLLIELANQTAAEIPSTLDGVAALEWHAERILRLARIQVNRARQDQGLFPVLYHTANDTQVHHLYTELIPGSEYAGDEQLCETPTPALICSCGRYVVEMVAPHLIG